MGKNLALGCLVAPIVGLLLCGFWAAGAYNRLDASEQGVDAAWEQVDSVYQRRAELVPNLVETVRGAASYEKSTMEAVVAARASAMQVKLDASSRKDPQAFARFQKAQDGLSSALSRLLVTVEKDPDLKATQKFRVLQAQLEGTENRIAVERGRFDETVQAYNSLRKSLPTVIVASFAGFRERPCFQAAPGSDRAPAARF